MIISGSFPNFNLLNFERKYHVSTIRMTYNIVFTIPTMFNESLYITQSQNMSVIIISLVWYQLFCFTVIIIQSHLTLPIMCNLNHLYWASKTSRQDIYKYSNACTQEKNMMEQVQVQLFQIGYYYCNIHYMVLSISDCSEKIQ